MQLRRFPMEITEPTRLSIVLPSQGYQVRVTRPTPMLQPQRWIPIYGSGAFPWLRLTALFDLSSGRCGPLLKYDTIANGVWYGACMIVSEYQFDEAGELY